MYKLLEAGGDVGPTCPMEWGVRSNGMLETKPLASEVLLKQRYAGESSGLLGSEMSGGMFSAFL